MVGHPPPLLPFASGVVGLFRRPCPPNADKSSGSHGVATGQAVAEFALVLPILLVLLVGIMEFGWMLHAYVSVASAAREGARAAALSRSNPAVTLAAQQGAPTLNPARMTVTITPPILASRSPNTPVSVRIIYAQPLLTPLFRPLLPDPVLLQAAVTMRVE